MSIETREFDVRLDNTEDRTVVGIVVPYGQEIDLGGFRERFERGAINPDDTAAALLLYGHKEPIGKVTRGTETEDGYVIEARISDTPRGNEVRTLMQDGVLTKMSIGFSPVEDRADNGVTVRTKVKFREASIVPFPAYDDAKILAVREEPETPTETPDPIEEPQVSDQIIDTEAREQLAEIERRMAVLSTPAPADASPVFRSFGEFVQNVAKGDDDAVALYRDLNSRAFAGAVAGATIANPDPIVKNAWVSDSVRLLDFGRPTLNAFRVSALPNEGMTIEWPEVATDAMQIGQQANEADNLTFGKITLRSKTSAVNTYGGYTAMSRQAIERSSLGYLDVALRAMVISYAKATNAAVISALAGTSGTGTATAAATSAGWIGAIADSAAHIWTTTGLRPEFILCATDVWKKIVKLVDGQDRGVIAASNPQNNTGSANIPGMTTTLLGLPVIVDPALANGACYVANPEAFITYESAGAPFRLQDEDIVNLTKEFSIYGYLALAAPLPGAIVKVTAS